MSVKLKRSAFWLALLCLMIFFFSACEDLFIENSESSTDDSASTEKEAYVKVYTNSSSTEYFSYEGFQFNGAYSLQVRDKTNTIWTINKRDMSEVKFYGLTWNNYYSKNCWEFNIYFSGTSIAGHIPSSDTTCVISGYDFKTGSSKAIRYSNVSSVKFYR